MKKRLLLLMLLLSGIAEAQIVNIPDPVFRLLLLNADAALNHVAKNSAGQWVAIDVNNDNEIQAAEAAAIHELYIDDDDGIFSIQGIEGFYNLRSLFIMFCDNLQALDATALTHLEYLKIDSCYNIETLNLSNLSNLESLTIDHCNDFPYTNVTGLQNLKHLHLLSTSTSIAFTQLPALETLYLFHYEHSVDLSNCLNLQSFSADDGHLGAVTFGNKPFLNVLTLTPMIYNAPLDISGCTALSYLRVIINYDYNEEIMFVKLKNGVYDYEHIDVRINAGTENMVYICVDEGNEGLVQNYGCMIGSYCTFTPGGNYNTITGTLGFDTDCNGCNSTDNFAGLTKLIISNGTDTGAVFSNGSGNYNFHTQAGTFTITPEFENNWFAATPASAAVTLSTVDNSTTMQHFCIAPNGIHPDLEVVMSPVEFEGPGFDAVYKIVYRNKGNQALSGNVVLNYEDSVLDYIFATPSASASTAGILTWNFADLNPFESRNVYVVLNVNGPMETPAVNIDDVLPFSVTAPLTGDETPLDNTFVLNHIVTGSFDPNDIACLEGGSVSPEKIGGYLHYNINFENTGTGAASFIVVKNMIDEEKFDVASFQVLFASHEVVTRMTGNKAEFIFDDINLAPAGKGNVLFKIKTLPTLQVNSEVTQQANIFFDYNWPIETNEATTVFEVLNTSDFEKDNSVKALPNPAKGIVTITADNTVRSIEMYDIQGRLLETGIVNDSSTTIDLAARPTGMYFVKVVTDKGIKVEKVVKE